MYAAASGYRAGEMLASFSLQPLQRLLVPLGQANICSFVATLGHYWLRYPSAHPCIQVSMLLLMCELRAASSCLIGVVSFANLCCVKCLATNCAAGHFRPPSQWALG